MPREGWKSRLLAVGNGGYAGTINYDQMASSLRGGFATLSTDTGHQAGPEDASWAFGHPEKVTDYGYRALHLTTLLGKQIVLSYYGKAVAHSYFDSCSNGGREGLMEAQRFPEDYDGVLAGAPANNWTHMLTSAIDVVQTMTGDPAAYVPTMKLPALHRAALNACDKRDGIIDGINSDPPSCHFDPASLLCKGADTLDCLTAPQVKTVRKLYEGGTTRDGKPLFPGYSPGSELPAWEFWVTGAGPGAGAGSRYPVNFFRYMVAHDPKWEILNADPAVSLKQADDVVGKALNATDPDLTPFVKRGGKLILYHGWDDAAISPKNSIAYLTAVRKSMGDKTADSAIRLYMVPGMEHCAGGPGPNSFGQLGLTEGNGKGSGALDALERWVETDSAPNEILASRFAGKDRTARATMTRPLCPYPHVAQYDGHGDPNRPESFSCKQIENQ